jgi:2-oxoglutarate dehydrogenase E2 component (dihydrolipoamide succinyltransferase)
MVDVKVPVLAESVSEATLMKWHKKEGDKIKRGDNLIDIETDKVTLEVAALSDGILSEILKADGETVVSDEVIARINNVNSASKAPEKSKKEPTKGQSLPGEGEASTSLKTSPAVRNLISEHNISTDDIPDSDGDGRLTKADVIDYLEKNPQAKKTSHEKPSTKPEISEVGDEQQNIEEVSAQVTEHLQESTSAPAPSPPHPQGRTEERVKMSRLRQRTAERLLSAQHENAILTTFNEVNMKPIMDLRSQYKDEFENQHGVKLGFMSFFTKAATEALKKFPVINASIDNNDILYHGYFDIGIAVSSKRGLVVPVLRDADTMSFADIEKQIFAYSQKAHDSKLTIDELTGGTFTITNGGIFGSLVSTPILNPPQSAILGMHKIQERPMAVNGEVVILPMMYLALSYDHRIVDGRDAVQFLVTIKNLLEDPARFLLQL